MSEYLNENIDRQPTISFLDSTMQVREIKKTVNFKGQESFVYIYERAFNKPMVDLRKQLHKRVSEVGLHGTSAMGTLARKSNCAGKRQLPLTPSIVPSSVSSVCHSPVTPRTNVDMVIDAVAVGLTSLAPSRAHSAVPIIGPPQPPEPMIHANLDAVINAVATGQPSRTPSIASTATCIYKPTQGDVNQLFRSIMGYNFKRVRRSRGRGSHERRKQQRRIIAEGKTN